MNHQLDNQIIAMRLKERREVLGISQQALSEATNINIKQIQKYENASAPIASSILYFFAKLLKMPVSYFMSEVPFAKYNAEYLFDNKNKPVAAMVA
ncbi:MAG: helix-turn-helix domain-containing protein [Rickettsia endosymbiont of Bryobia graminum]|nr:helix-turn-helix domain-containing protein [Rickettsia endosymbiont of Bryobia graminum]